MTTRKESYEFKPLVFQPVRPRGNLKDGEMIEFSILVYEIS